MAEVIARGEEHGATAGGGRGIDGFINGRGVERLAVAGGAIGADIKRRGGGRGSGVSEAHAGKQQKEEKRRAALRVGKSFMGYTVGAGGSSFRYNKAQGNDRSRAGGRGPERSAGRGASGKEGWVGMEQRASSGYTPALCLQKPRRR